MNFQNRHHLDDQQLAELDNGIRMDSLWKVLKFDNLNNNGNNLKIKDIFMAHEYDGLIYMTSINTTYTTYPIPVGCPYVGKYRLDLRCRYYYPPTTKNISIMLYDPQIFYTEGNPHLASPFCQRRLKYQTNDPNSESQLYSVLCITLDLSKIPQYFQNFSQNSKYQLFLDPRKLTVIYHSQIPLQRATIATVEDFETNYLQDQNEAQKFLDNINQFQQYILESSDEVQNVGVRTDIARKTFEYKRNGTECFVIVNLITMIDKVPRFENLKSNNPSKKFQTKGAFLFLDVLSKEKMTQFSYDLKQQIKTFNSYFNYTSWTLIILVLGFQIYYSFHLGKNLMNPVIHLTSVLKSIHFQNGKQPYQELPPQPYRKQSSQPDQYSQNQNRNHATSFMSEVCTEQDNIILIDEQLDADSKGVCFSSDTQVLLDSFQNLFKILRFTTQNIYKENDSISLLNLNIQIQYFEQFGNYRALGVCHNNMGVIHYNSGRYTEAIESFQKALIYAKYELNFYSQDNLEGQNLTVNIKKNTVQLRSTLIKKSNSQDSLNNRTGTTILNERAKNKSTFVNQSVGNPIISQFNAEKEQYYWNLYNRNQNLLKALASYLTKCDNNSNNMWDIFSDIALENASISQHYLHTSYKREMLNYYTILYGYFNQNLYDETNYILTKFSNLYIKNFQMKNPTPKNNVEGMSQSQIYGQFQNNCQSQTQFSLNVNESQMFSSQILFNGSNIASDQLGNSIFLMTPLHKQKSKQKKKIQFQELKQNSIRSNSNMNKPNHIKSNLNTINTNQNINKSNFNMNKPNQLMSFEDKTKFLKHKFSKQLNKQQSKDVESGIQDTPYSQNTNHINMINSSPYEFGTKMGILYEVQSSNSSRKSPQNSEYNFIKSHNNYSQNQNINILRQNSSKSIHRKISDLINDNPGLQNQVQRSQIVGGINLNERPLDQHKDIPNTPNSGIKSMNFMKSKNRFESSSNQFDCNNSIPETIIVKNVLKGQNGVIGDYYLKTDSKIKQQRKQTYTSQNSKEGQQQCSETQKQFKSINKSQVKINKKKLKKQIYFQVRKMNKSDKVSLYEFSSDIFFFYYAIQQAHFQIKRQNYKNAAILLTNVLEQCEFYLPNQKLTSLQKLSTIFEKQNIFSPEFEEMRQRYIQFSSYSYSTCVISSCQSSSSKLRVYTVCSDLLNEILFQDTDSFGMINYSFEEGIYLQLMGLTTQQTIKTAPLLFDQIIMQPTASSSKIRSSCLDTLLKNRFTKVSQISRKESNISSIKYSSKNQNQAKTQNLQHFENLNKSQFNENIIQITKEMSSIQSNLVLKLQNVESDLGLSHNQQLHLSQDNNDLSLELSSSFESQINSDYRRYNNKNNSENSSQNQISQDKLKQRARFYQQDYTSPPKQNNLPSNFSQFKQEIPNKLGFCDNIIQENSLSAIIPSYLFNKQVKSMTNSSNNSNNQQIQNNGMSIIQEDEDNIQLKQSIMILKDQQLFDREQNNHTNMLIYEQSYTNSSTNILCKNKNKQTINQLNSPNIKSPVQFDVSIQLFNPTKYLENDDCNNQMKKLQQIQNTHSDSLYLLLDSNKVLQNNQPLGDNGFNNCIDSSLLNIQNSILPTYQLTQNISIKKIDYSLTPKHLIQSSRQSFIDNQNSQNLIYGNTQQPIQLQLLNKKQNQVPNNFIDDDNNNNYNSISQNSLQKCFTNNNEQQKESTENKKDTNLLLALNKDLNQIDYLNNSKIHKSPIFLAPNNIELNMDQNMQLSPPPTLQECISSLNPKINSNLREQNQSKNNSQTQNGEYVFHQGIQAALKYFILNTDEKLSCYLSQNKFSQNRNQKMTSSKTQKTFLIYITDQNLQLKNKYFLQLLCQLLWNLDLELLILELNPKQAFEEFSKNQNIFQNNKSLISFFTSEQKLLQYMYNQREHVKNNLTPMVVEHF